MVTLLRVLTDQRGWNDFDTFRTRYRTAAGDEARASGEPGLATLDLSEDTYDRWYAGMSTPQRGARRVLARLFGRPIAELLATAPDGPAPRTAQHTVSTGGIVSAPHTDHTPEPGDPGWMERHAKMAARRAIEFAMGAEHNAIGPETLDYLQAEVRRLAGVYNRVPLGTILDDMIDVQDKTFRLLEGGRAKPSQMRDLYLLAAIQSGLLAKTSHDVGDPQSAMRQARTASVCAEQAEHTGMIAWVNGLKSLIAYWSGRPTDALFYAQSGAQIATTLTGSVGTWLAGLEARAAAVLGDARTVTAANLRGDELRNHTTPDLLDDLGGFFRFPLVRQRYYDVESAVLLGNVGGSSSSLVERAEGAVRGYSNPDDEDWAFGDEAGTRTDLALAHLLVGSLDGAAAAVRPVLELPPAQRNAGILVSVARVAKSLGDDSFRGTGVARDLREEITAFSGSGRLPLGLPR